MTRSELIRILLEKHGAYEDRPFGPDTAVYKVMGKMFALLPDDFPLRLNLKCDPDEALFLRDMYPAVVPGYHMNKRHWNTVTVDGTIPEPVIVGMVDASYDLVVRGLPAADQAELQNSKRG